MQEVLDTAYYVSEVSRKVRIDKQALARLCKRFCKVGITVPVWNRRYHFDGRGKDRVFYLLVLDSLNFCFWPAPGKAKWEIECNSETLSGYYALATALKQALKSGIPITEADYLAELSFGKLKGILAGRGELQLLQERVQILNELGQFLLEQYDGKAYGLVEAAQNSAVKLVMLLVEKLASFRDLEEYAGHRILFYKRAQIFAADLYGAFNGDAWGRFTDMERLTAFADYRLPQVLRHLGILHYKLALAQKVDQGILLESGGPEEIEIRANTIWAVELIRQGLNRMGRDLRAFEIDWILWNLGQDQKFKAKPYHRTVTIFY